MNVSKQDRLEFSEDLEFQRMSWKFQRVGFIGLLLFIFAGLLGLFGDGGWLSSTESTRGKLMAHYDRFVRFSAPTEMEIDLPLASARALSVNRSFIEGVKIDQIIPPPDEIAVTSDAFIYSFRRTTSSISEIRITISYTPRRIGVLKCEIGAGEVEKLNFSQLAYP